jgi:hypothetical protein
MVVKQTGFALSYQETNDRGILEFGGHTNAMRDRRFHSIQNARGTRLSILR